MTRHARHLVAVDVIFNSDDVRLSEVATGSRFAGFR
jgi:hypothetical protein